MSKGFIWHFLMKHYSKTQLKHGNMAPWFQMFTITIKNVDAMELYQKKKNSLSKRRMNELFLMRFSEYMVHTRQLD